LKNLVSDRILLATEEAGFDGILATEEAGFHRFWLLKISKAHENSSGTLAGFDPIMAIEESGF
jgi:hypothetical protein